MNAGLQHDPRAAVRNAMVNKVFSLAEPIARRLKRGDEFVVAFPDKDIPEGAHYAEITGELDSQSENHGYIFYAAKSIGWKYRFKKL